MTQFCRAALLIFLALLLTASITVPGKAQMGGLGRKGKGVERSQAETSSDDTTLSSDGIEQRDHEITATGLTGAFPKGFNCQAVASPFASPYRYDGSKRRSDRNSGLHGGIDLSLKEGTPLLAVASGEVIARGEGGQLEGIFLWLRHAPADTGLPYWVFTKYQHLATLPDLTEGDRVQLGQVIALAGKTGTTGGHYGATGYPHLHLSTFYGPSKEYTVKGMYSSMVHGQGAIPDDPLILYLRGVNGPAQVRGLSEDRRKVDIAVVGEDGAVYPAGSTLVWPVRCERK